MERFVVVKSLTRKYGYAIQAATVHHLGHGPQQPPRSDGIA